MKKLGVFPACAGHHLELVWHRLKAPDCWQRPSNPHNRLQQRKKGLTPSSRDISATATAAPGSKKNTSRGSVAPHTALVAFPLPLVTPVRCWYQ